MISRLSHLMNFLVGFAVGSRSASEAPAASENAESSKEPPISKPPKKTGRPLRNDRSYDVFVSYRRDKGSEVARVLAEKLERRGYRVFLDVDSLGSGEWGSELRARIEECPDFIAVITDGYFVRCENPDDVVRKEIAHALGTQSTVVPLFVGEGKLPADLPPDISGLSAHNGVKYLHEYANQAIDKVCQFLTSTPLLGPERLGTGEAQPRIVLLAVLFAIGVWRGAVMGENTGYLGAWWVAPLFGLGFGLICNAVVLVPTLVGLTIYGKKRSIRLDALYAGPWTPFWVFVIPFMFVITSVVVPAIQGLTGIRSFFFGGILGGLLAFGVTRFLVATNLWAEVTNALGLSSRVAGKPA